LFDDRRSNDVESEIRMCGIAGSFVSSDIKLIKSMLNSIKHRGPDDEGVFSDDSITLGVNRLAIVDSKHGSQPMHNEKNTLWVVFNGEIYNFLEIREELVNLGHKFETTTDTETIVHAYEEWGINCLQRFNGMFAFAIWDKNKRKLFLARDRMGIKPLYYYNHPKKFIFASEIKALFADPEIPRKPNNQIICNFLLTGFQNHNGETFFGDLKELLPAHYMIVDKKQIVIKKYWNLTPSETQKPETDEFYSSKMRELLLDAIKIRLPEDLSIGSFLSGGLDSTSLVCLADSILRSGFPSVKGDPPQQKLFSAFYQEAEADERPFIEEVSRLVKIKINYVFPSTTMKLDDVRTFAYYMDEPVTVLNYYAYWCLARITKEQVRVTFSGQGPDEILAGHPDHFETYVKELWQKKKSKRLLIELISGLNRYGLLSVIKQVVARIMSRRIRVEELIDPKFLALHKKNLTNGTDSSLNTALLSDVTLNRLPMHLRVGDRVSSAFSTETRCPYLDYRIVEFGFSLPEEQKIKNAWSKYVLRNAVKGLIPESVRKRKKFGTPIPLDHWLKDLHQEINQIFGSSRFRERGYFNQAKILDIYDRYCKGKLSPFERKFYADMIWRVLNLELWLETFFDNSPGIMNI
jgi:asparagine synthase (glutamine-hydrolysing)